MKKALSLAVCIFMLLSSTPAYASRDLNAEALFSGAIYSPEFPDALVEVDNDTFQMNRMSGNASGVITATVYVAETSNIINGELQTTESKLLSRYEVDSIGRQNFIDNSTAATRASGSTGTIYYNLKLTLTANDFSNSSTPAYYQVSGQAEWSGYHPFYDDYSPANGEDYMALYWGGQFGVAGYGQSSTLNTGASNSIYLSDLSPNAAYVWRFNEHIQAMSFGAYAAKTNVQTSLYKNSLTGNGNTTTIAVKYIHTWVSHSPSISISVGSGGVTPSIGLNGTPQQWSLVAPLSGFKY